ncbi:MAG: ABC transporter permease, partial [Planctomycetales bacterium]|nr:ABC transporter permease [Planctomycetales bacterium]
ELTFFEPESTHGEAIEQTASFLLAAVAPLAAPGEPATPATDPHFTPEVPGLTDKDSIDNWDPPFPYDASRVRSTPPNNQDDRYWKEHRATPKAFVSLAAGQKLWQSRFGSTTTIRIPATQEANAESVAVRLRAAISPSDLGFVFRPIKRSALTAAQGTTAFEGLFIGFSFFLIAAAVMLVAILFQLGIEQRASQVGLMLAVGLRRKLVARALGREGLLVAAVGGAIGVGLGVGYAALMIAGLNSPSWWGGAIAAPFLTLHWESPTTLVVGFLSGVVVSWLTILWSVRRMNRLAVGHLMAGRSSDVGELGAPTRKRFSLARWLAAAMLLAAVGLLVLATQLAGEAQAGAFFGGGAAALTATLLFIWSRLRQAPAKSAIGAGRFPLVRFAM